ncbi:hypothetical protein HOLleu_41613 [Holothuria leucospilota]|uniref:C2H2-type domain-containing protein n=1 Tax=Holothuria leucospilota TaxID=206669 RepID=A0A9Q1BBX4_HOLLE|nr:hypothetical protein HOLleu_41613 [Holothuria leucospilota]
MSCKTKEDDLKEAEELLAVKDRRIKELERILLKAQMLLQNAGVSDILTSSPDGVEDENTDKIMRVKPDSHQGGSTESEIQPDRRPSEGSVDNEQSSQNSERRREYSPKSSQETLDNSSTVVRNASAIPVNLDVSVSSQSGVVTHTPSSKVSDRDALSVEVSTSGPTTSAVISPTNKLSSTMPTKSGELVCAENSREYVSPSTSPSRIMVVPTTTKECNTVPHVSPVTINSSPDSTALLFRQRDSSQLTPTVNNYNASRLNFVATGTSPSSGSPVSTLKYTTSPVPSCATTSGSFTSTSYASIVNTVSSPGTTSCSSVSASSARVVTVPLLTTTSGSLICRSQVDLEDTISVLSSSDPKVTSAVDGSTPATKSVESTRILGDANMKGQLGDVAIYFADDFENFDIAQEETVSMESDISKQDADNDDDEEETFVPPSDFQSTIGKGSKTHGKYFPDLFDFACQEQNHQPTKRLQKNVCGECGKVFASKRILRQHVKIIHESEQTYLCNVCQKVFRHLHNLNIHKQNQNHFSEGEKHLAKERKLFKCSICHKTFRQKSNLQDHVRLHSGDRPFGCSYCDRKFAQISNCRKHELTHTGKRPFSCDQCHKTFTSSSNLKRHQVAHSLHKNYLCPICGNAFTQKWNLTKHEKKHKTCHKSKSSESIVISKSEANKVISSPAIEVKVVHIL